MKDDKLEFIKNEILTSTIVGGLGRGYSVYKKGVQENDKNKLKNLLRETLDNYSKIYKDKVNEKHHIENIKRFAEDITDKYARILQDNRFRIGRAQKLLNLYLKYLWTLGLIPKPPHCPFDSVIISRLGLDIKWTQLDSIEDYKLLVKRAKEAAERNGLSIAEWELRIWNRQKTVS